MIGFEVGKDAIQPLIDSIEMRTGKKVEFEPRPERHRETNIEVGSNDPGSTL
jgi:hypothetical protein